MGASLHLLHLSHQLPGAAQDFFSTASKQNKEITMTAIKQFTDRDSHNFSETWFCFVLRFV